MARLSPFAWNGFFTLALGAALGLIVPACSEQDEIQTYDETPVVATNPSPGLTAPLPAELPLRDRVTYQTPEGWTPGEVGGMRKAAFRIQRDGKQVDVTVIDLTATAGALLPNVNRWRQQIQLAELTQEELEETLTSIQTAGVEGKYVELVSSEGVQPPQAILGVVAIKGDKSWFVKLWGDAGLALEEKQRFQEFAKSLKIEAAEPGDPTPGGLAGKMPPGHGSKTSAGTMPPGTMPPGHGTMTPAAKPPAGQGTTAQAAAEPPGKPPIQFATPEGWTPSRVGGMRKAAFRVNDGKMVVETTAIDLSVSAGSLLPNVNRWRQQIQLDQITEEELENQLIPIQVGGEAGQYVELIGPKDIDRPLTILGVVVVRSDRAWFFKMVGDTELALREKGRFEEFVQSVTFEATADRGDE